ncbi:hypothetical protein SUGI_0654160 [Cryptomeria japonica]|nr:hypothetical protein SUGI_0654160 [Cryptomeria japonica]
MSSTHRHFGDPLPHQDRNGNMVGKPPSDREAPSLEHSWKLVLGKRVARAEKREARAYQESMSVIPITSRILDYATKENCIPLGFRENSPGPGHPLRKPQQNSRPHNFREEGYRRIAKDGGRALQYHGHKSTNYRLVSKLWDSLHHGARREGALAMTKPDPKFIKILNPREAMDLNKYCRGHELFAKWGGNNQALARIVDWWKTTFHDQKVHPMEDGSSGVYRGIGGTGYNVEKKCSSIHMSNQDAKLDGWQSKSP